MVEPLIKTNSPAEYFRELVESAMRNQRVRASELTLFYIVCLLARFIHLDRPMVETANEGVGVHLARGFWRQGADGRDHLRRVGDISLFMAGFFSDSMNRRLIDVNYYIQVGGHAYGSLSGRREESLRRVFGELARKFIFFVDVLSEVSERTALTSNADLLRLYEKWLRTRSRRSGDLLVERGIIPNSSIGSRFIQ